MNQLIDERAQPAPRHQRRIQVAHRSRGGVSGVGKERLAGILALFVDPRERRPRQEQLAAHLDAARRSVAQGERDRLDRPHVRRHVLAAHAVAARGAAHEGTVLVGERDAEAVNLQLGHIRHRRVAEPGPLPHALIERAELLLVVRVVEAQHRHEVLGRGEAFDRPAGDALCRGIRRDEIGVIPLERLELFDQRVERVVGDFRVVVDVVALFVVTNLAAELVDAEDSGIQSNH